MPKGKTKRRTPKRASAFPKTAIKRKMKEHGVKRISEDAVKEVQRELDEKLIMIAERSAAFAHHGHRKTVNKKDILLDGID